jgi:hypothetical protein
MNGLVQDSPATIKCARTFGKPYKSYWNFSNQAKNDNRPYKTYRAY